MRSRNISGIGALLCLAIAAALVAWAHWVGRFAGDVDGAFTAWIVMLGALAFATSAMILFLAWILSRAVRR